MDVSLVVVVMGLIEKVRLDRLRRGQGEKEGQENGEARELRLTPFRHCAPNWLAGRGASLL